MNRVFSSDEVFVINFFLCVSEGLSILGQCSKLERKDCFCRCLGNLLQISRYIFFYNVGFNHDQAFKHKSMNCNPDKFISQCSQSACKHARLIPNSMESS